MTDNIILKMTGIEKRFKGVYALKNFNFYDIVVLCE